MPKVKCCPARASLTSRRRRVRLVTRALPKCPPERHRAAVLELSGMPIYEYDCRDCRRVVSVLVLRPSAAEPPRCPRCAGVALTRLMSRFATIKSEEARLESLADSSSFGDVDENDPASVARFMKKMGREMGDDVGEDFDEVMDEALDESTSDEGSTDSVPSSGAADEL